MLNICNAILEVSKVECKSVEFQISSVCNFLQKSDINAFVVDTLNVQPNSFKISSLKNETLDKVRQMNLLRWKLVLDGC